MSISQKEKKITVKFFLNQAVEPVLGEKREKHYSLYVQVTYNRKNMQFKSHYGEYYKALEEVKPTLLKFEEKIIRRIISYEAAQIKGEYELKGLKRKYAVYSTSILSAVEAYLKPKLRLTIFGTNNELSQVLNFNEDRITVGILYKAAELLFTDFGTYINTKLHGELNAYDRYVSLYKGPVLTYNFPTIIEWMDGSYKAALTSQLEAAFKGKRDESKQVVALIDQAVKQSLKALEV